MSQQLSIVNRLVALVAACMVTAALAPALRAAPPKRGSQPAAAERALQPGDVDTKLSRVYIFVDKTGLGHQHAVEGRLKEGRLKVAAEAAGKLVFDMKSFVADTPAARNYLGLPGETDASTQQQVNANMLGAGVLDVARFPTATFAIDSIKKSQGNEGSDTYTLAGTYTLHGISRKLQFEASGTTEKGMLRLYGRFAIRQTDFGIRPFSKGLGLVGVADDLVIHGDLMIAQ